VKRERENMIYEPKNERNGRAEIDREQLVLEALKKIKFGSVEVIVHEGQVVQIESKEKIRFAHAQ
jgi:hypothetical protein